MDRPSLQLADRYGLTLNESWQSWFDHDSQRIQPAGCMREVLTAEDLLARAPKQIWPGFMLPDTLPIVGNEYGDWICVRIEADGCFGELIYWYHGGGDWIPVGNSLGEALLHDAVDQFRTVRKQMLRGAPETRAAEDRETLMRLASPDFTDWFTRQLARVHPSEPDAGDGLHEICELLRTGAHRVAIELLVQRQWAQDAAACDLIELELQAPVQALAVPDVARRVSMSWYPEFVALLFDIDEATPDLKERLLLASQEFVPTWPSQNWVHAMAIADEVSARRQDLGWAFTVSGWGRQRAGKLDEAAQIYWTGRFASSFTDQSVRLNSHSVSEEVGKFAIEQLSRVGKYLAEECQGDEYLSIFFRHRTRSLLAEVHDYWWDCAQQANAAGEYSAAYEFTYRSGWDMGVSRLADYQKILKCLAENARLAGWNARAIVAETHLNCLENR